jgi:hypothetical protein
VFMAAERATCTDKPWPIPDIQAPQDVVFVVLML